MVTCCCSCIDVTDETCSYRQDLGCATFRIASHINVQQLFPLEPSPCPFDHSLGWHRSGAPSLPMARGAAAGPAEPLLSQAAPWGRDLSQPLPPFTPGPSSITMAQLLEKGATAEKHKNTLGRVREMEGGGPGNFRDTRDTWRDRPRPGGENQTQLWPQGQGTAFKPYTRTCQLMLLLPR